MKMLNKVLSQTGWRVLSHSLLAVAGLGHLYYLSRMVADNLQRGSIMTMVLLGVAIVIALGVITLGSMLSKAELTSWN